MMLVGTHTRRIDRSPLTFCPDLQLRRSKSTSRIAGREEYVPEAFLNNRVTERYTWTRMTTSSFCTLCVCVCVYTRLSYIYSWCAQSARESPRSHASTLIPCPVTTSRIIRPSGITNDAERTAPPDSSASSSLYPHPFPVYITCCFVPLPLLSALVRFSPRKRGEDAASPFDLYTPASYLQLVAESIRRNVVLTGSYKRRSKNRQASHKHL